MKKFPFNKGDEIIVSFSKKASSRTKGRVRDHGPRFVFNDVISSFRGPGTLSGRPCVLVTSLSTDWSGWFPCNEVGIAPA